MHRGELLQVVPVGGEQAGDLTEGADVVQGEGRPAGVVVYRDAVERAEAEDALDRFVAWQEARDHLELLGTEVPFRCEVDAGGRRVLLTGTADNESNVAKAATIAQGIEGVKSVDNKVVKTNK